MDRNDIIDLLTIVQSVDKRTVGETDIVMWHQLLGQFDKDDCTDAILAHRREQPGTWLEPGHLVQRVKAVVRDRYDRAEPDLRDQRRPLPPGARRDRYGHIDKSSPDLEYPVEWTPMQRAKASWDEINRHRDTTGMSAWDDRTAPGAPAGDAVRTAAMTTIREALNKTGTKGVNPLSVRCPFCHSAPGEPCTCAEMPGRPREPLRRSRAHPGRVEAAARAAGMSKEAAAAITGVDQATSIKLYRVNNPAGGAAVPVATARTGGPEGASEPADAPA